LFDLFCWETGVLNEQRCKTKALESPYDKINFPISFGLKLHDVNYNNVLRFWLTFTYDPITGMSHPYEQKAIAKHTIAPPLILKNTSVSISSYIWKKT